MAQRRVKYSEAVELICSEYQIGRGEADALFWRAVASRENGPAWTEAAIINQERRAPRAAGASFDLRRMLDRQAAHERAKARLRLLIEHESVAFKDAVIAGEIVFSEAALLSWLSRNRRRAAVVSKKKAERRRKKVQTSSTGQRKRLTLCTRAAFRCRQICPINYCAAKSLTGLEKIVKNTNCHIFKSATAQS
jgi:hypothetical protein